MTATKHTPGPWPYVGNFGKQTFIISGVKYCQAESGFFIDYSLVGESFGCFSCEGGMAEIIGTVVSDILQRGAK